MIDFKFFQENKYDIEHDPLYTLDAYQNMALGLINYCYRMNLSPIGYQHQFDESTSTRGPGFITRHLVINDVISHDYFETRHVRIRYEIYDVNGTNRYTFHLDEQVFETLMRRYENL